MNPNNQNNQMSPEEAKASLGIATHLQSMLMPTAPPEQNSSPANEPGTTQNPASQEDVKSEITGLETRILDELKTLREEIKQVDSKNNSNDFAELKKKIESVLAQTD